MSIALYVYSIPITVVFVVITIVARTVWITWHNQKILALLVIVPTCIVQTDEFFDERPKLKIPTAI